MLRYTARDSGQEFIMKRKMIHALILALITTIAMVVFIALYIDETRRVQETYREKYMLELSSVSENIGYYLNAEADYGILP